MKIRIALWLMLLAACLLMAARLEAATNQIRGVASVVDGDTLEIAGQRIRLLGIDAPESSQWCGADKTLWPCGRRIAQTLDQTIGGKSVACRVTDKDRYGRSIAECYFGQASINAWLVSEGMAMAYRTYSEEYIDEEAAARSARKGIWSGPFVAPWDYRKKTK